MSGAARSVLVTGAASGIGYGIATLFARAGDHVAMLDRDQPKVEQAASQLRSEGGEVLPVAVDVRDAGSIRAAVEQAVRQHGRLDVAVSNAGVYPNTPVLEMDEDEWDLVLDTNLKGTYLVCRAAARQMVEQNKRASPGQGGKICAIASGAHQSARVGAAHYCASKAGLGAQDQRQRRLAWLRRRRRATRRLRRLSGGDQSDDPVGSIGPAGGHRAGGLFRLLG